MAKAFRYLLFTSWANLAAIPITALSITVLTAISGAPMKDVNFFSTYFVALPLICLLFLFIYGASLCSTSLHIALSLGCRRKDFFGALCGLVIARSRKLGAILFAFAMILVLAIMVAAGIIGIFALYVPVFSTLSRWLWVLCVAVILVCLLLVRRQIFRFVVK